MYHCPWESSMLVSAEKFGGCDSFKYICDAMNVPALIATYTAHSTKATPPPEGSPEFVKYTMCCLQKWCPQTAGTFSFTCNLALKPNKMGMRLFDAEMPSVTK